MTENKKKIILTGGGTGGSVSPLLAIFDEFKNSDPEFNIKNFIWIGTKFGPEKIMVEKEGIEFIGIQSGKWRRYFSWQNFIDLFKIKFAFWQSLFLIFKIKPALVLAAGSFVSVPVIWAAWILRVPVIIHQQDVIPGLANQLMAPFARVVTVTFGKSLKDYGRKAILTGNPVRAGFKNQSIDKNKIFEKFGLSKDLPVVLIVGGGTGARPINDLTAIALTRLTEYCQIIHVTGKNKTAISAIDIKKDNYRAFEFLKPDEITQALNIADIVISRAGLSFLTELSYLGKPSIIIPMPNTHQEANAHVFQKYNAALVLDQRELTSQEFDYNIKQLLFDTEKRLKLSQNIRKVMKAGAEEEMVEIIQRII